MTKRIDIEQSLPEVWKAMYALTASLNNSTLTPIQKHLIMVRASQINSCAFCIDMHTKEALKAGETQQRLFLLSSWKETELFTEQERAILGLTEDVTLIHQQGVSEHIYWQLENFFYPDTIAEIIMFIVIINAWNRIAISTQMPLKGFAAL